MRIISLIKGLVVKSTALRILSRNLIYSLKRWRYKFRGISVQVDDKMIFFGAYNGKNYACSPKRVYEYMIQDERFIDYKFIWMFDNPECHSVLKNNRNTILVKSNSLECEKYLNQAKYWIINFRALDHWTPKKEQIYVQCWHGTPLKRLGYDITNSDNAMNSVSEIRAKYKIDTERFDYMVSPCDFVTEKFTSAWDLKSHGKAEAVLQIGYPRNDFLKTFDGSDVKRIKQTLNLEKENKKIILYAPTWRDNQHDSSKGYTYDNPVDFDYLREQLGDEYIILFRAHYLVADNFDFAAYNGFVYDVSKYDDINELYIISDVLITDYSSVFFDYAILERPMIFYMYDMEEYRDEMRGFYLDVDRLPGEIVKTEKEIVTELRNISHKAGSDQKEIKAFNEEYNSMNDGRAAERLVDYIIGK